MTTNMKLWKIKNGEIFTKFNSRSNGNHQNGGRGREDCSNFTICLFCFIHFCTHFYCHSFLLPNMSGHLSLVEQNNEKRGIFFPQFNPIQRPQSSTFHFCFVSSLNVCPINREPHFPRFHHPSEASQKMSPTITALSPLLLVFACSLCLPLLRSANPNCNEPDASCLPTHICRKNGTCHLPEQPIDGTTVQCGNRTCNSGELCIKWDREDWHCNPTGQQPCGQRYCLAGQICLVQPGMFVCVNIGGQPAQCGNQTGGNSTDGGDNHGGQGGGIPRECNSKRDCPSGETCVLQQGEHKCMPEVEGPQGGGETTSQPPKCTQECDEANECNFVDGQMRCCPKGQGCDRGTG